MALKRSGTARTVAKKSAAQAAKKRAKPATAAKTVAKKKVASKAVAKKALAKKALAKKPAPRKAAIKKVAAKKTAAKKTALKKPAPKKAAAKKAIVKQATPKKAAGKKVLARKAAPARKPARAAAAKPAQARKASQVTLLSGGNPQIAKGFGNAPVKAYIAAMPGWKRKAGAHLDRLIERAVPNVYKAVKWNSPLYGIQGDGWFIGMHCYNEFIKVAFFRGASLNPPPPGPSTQKWVRYLNLRKEDAIDETQFMDWVKQASHLPGEKM